MQNGLALERRLITDATRFAENGWAWINQNLALFVPDDPLDPADLQKCAELALLYSTTVSWSEDRRAELHRTKEFLLNFLADPAMAQHARKRLIHYNPYFVPYLALRSLGYRSVAYEEGLFKAGRAGYPGALELTPYRELEIAHLAWRAGLREERPLCTGVYEATVLARCQNPIHLDLDAVYSITHTLFYLNDFCGPPEVMPAAEVRRAAQLVESLLVHYWRKWDWDVVGELLLNLVSLDRCDTTLFRLGIGALMEAWGSQPDGALPGRSFEPSESEAEPGYRFKHCYHTTVVGILLCEAYRHRFGVS